MINIHLYIYTYVYVYKYACIHIFPPAAARSRWKWPRASAAIYEEHAGCLYCKYKRTKGSCQKKSCGPGQTRQTTKESSENSWNPCKKYIKGGRCSWCWQMSHGCQNLQKPTGHNTKVRSAGVIMPLVKAFAPHGPHGPHKSRDAPIPSAFCIFVFVKRAPPLQPCANSSGLIFQKCSEHFGSLKFKSSSQYGLVHFL